VVHSISRSKHLLTVIARWTRGHSCERLVKRTANEIQISGASFDAGSVKVDVGSLSNKVKNLAPASELALTLDDSQYLLCREVENLAELRFPSRLREDVARIRIMMILEITQLRALMASLNQQVSPDLKKELSEWIRHSNQLLMHATNLIMPASVAFGALGPSKREAKPLLGMPARKPTMALGEIMRYQGIKKTELDKALMID
jgi:hypothetical protein